MAGGRWRGGSGGGWSGPSGRRDYDLDDAEFTDLIAAGLGMSSGMRPETMEHMKRIIATQDSDRDRTMRMMETFNVRSEEREEHVGPLHDAASKGQMDTCKHLVEHLGFDVNSVATDGSGLTPLSCAVSHGKAIVVRYFLDKGYDGMTRLLISRGACVDISSSEGTPLHVAALYGKSGVLQILLEHLANDTTSSGVRKDQLKLLGQEAVAEMDYASASKFYTKAIDLDPADATLYSNRSLCNLKLGEAGDALCDANSCIRLRPEWQKGYYRKGAALMSLKEYKEASDAFMDGLRLDPSNVDMRNAYWEASEAMRIDGTKASSLD